MPIPCETCDSGSLEEAKSYQRNGCLVAIGSLLMIPALVLVLILVLQLLMGVGEIPEDAPAQENRVAGIQARLEAVHVPEAIIEKVMTVLVLEEEDEAALTPDQLQAVRGAQIAMALPALGELLEDLAYRFFVFLLITSIAGALLGWFLVRRTKVLCCNMRGTIHPAPHSPLPD